MYYEFINCTLGTAGYAYCENEIKPTPGVASLFSVYWGVSNVVTFAFLIVIILFLARKIMILFS